MTGPWKGAGASIGEGLALFTQNFIQRQDQLRQQQIEEEQRRQQAAQIEMQNQRAAQDDELRRQQLALQQQQYTESRGDVTFNRDRQTRLDGLQTRDDEVKTALSPQVSAFMQGVSADLERYGPTTKDGKPNPQFNPALLQAAQDRSRQIKKLWSGVTLAVGNGEGYEDAKRALVGFVGGDVQPMTAAPTQPQTPTPAPTPVSVQEPGGASFNFTPEAAPPAPVMPTAPTAPTAPAQNVRTDMPGQITQIPPSQLMDMDDAQIMTTYGQSGVEYANAARTEYGRQQAAQDEAAAKARSDAWEIQLKELSKDPALTGDQRFAAQTITELMRRPTLTPEEQARMRTAFSLLTPVMYTAKSWQSVLDTKDSMVILSMLPVYQKNAPSVVAGYDDSVVATFGQSTLDERAANAAQSMSAAGASDAAAASSRANAARTTALLPGEAKQQGADLLDTQTGIRKTDAEITQIGVENDQTRGEIAAKKVDTTTASYDLAVKKLSQIAATNATVYQLKTTNPQLWASLKRDMGVNDAGLTALLQEARYMNNLDVKEKELGIRKKASEILSEDASRAQTLAETGEIVAMLPGKVDQQGAQLELTTAQAGQAQAATALNWTRNGEIEARLKIDRQRAAAYIKGVEGNYIVDMARVKEISANTALKQASDPNSPLYNPKIAAAKAGDPVDALKKKASVYYTQQDNALQQATAMDKQIKVMVDKYTDEFKGFQPDKMTAADKASLNTMRIKRNRFMREAAAARQQGDNIITKGMAALPEAGGGTGKGGSDPYGITNVGGVQMVTTFPSKYPVPKTFNSDARYHISKVAGELGVDANALAAIISFETRGTFSPSEKNPNSSGSGLIQFMESTAAGMGTTTAALRKMTFQQQMQYVKRYLEGRGIGPGSSMADMYQAVAGSGYKKGTDAYELNKVWDADKDGVIEANEQTNNPVFAGHVRDYFGTGRAAAGPQRPAATTARPATTPRPAATTARPATPAARPAATPPPTTTTPPAGVKRPKLDTPSLAVATRAEQALIRSVKAGDGNTAYAMYSQLVNLGYDSGSLLAYMQKNKVQK